MQLSPLVIALQGIGFGALATALQGFVALDQPEPEPDQGGQAGGAKGRKRFSPWLWMPPLPPQRRPRKKREAELVAFLGP